MYRWDIARINQKDKIQDRCRELDGALQNLARGKDDFKTSGFYEFMPVLLTHLLGFDNKPYVVKNHLVVINDAQWLVRCCNW